jgi:hypothetical protein
MHNLLLLRAQPLNLLRCLSELLSFLNVRVEVGEQETHAFCYSVHEVAACFVGVGVYPAADYLEDGLQGIRSARPKMLRDHFSRELYLVCERLLSLDKVANLVYRLLLVAASLHRLSQHHEKGLCHALHYPTEIDQGTEAVPMMPQRHPRTSEGDVSP